MTKINRPANRQGRDSGVIGLTQEWYDLGYDDAQHDLRVSRYALEDLTDEIEGLQAENEKLRELTSDHEKALRAEIVELRAENEKYHEGYLQGTEDAQSQLEELAKVFRGRVLGLRESK